MRTTRSFRIPPSSLSEVPGIVVVGVQCACGERRLDLHPGAPNTPLPDHEDEARIAFANKHDAHLQLCLICQRDMWTVSQGDAEACCLESKFRTIGLLRRGLSMVYLHADGRLEVDP